MTPEKLAKTKADIVNSVQLLRKNKPIGPNQPRTNNAFAIGARWKGMFSTVLLMFEWPSIISIIYGFGVVSDSCGNWPSTPRCPGQSIKFNHCALHIGHPAAYVDPQNACAAQIAYLLPVKKLQIAAVAANLYLGGGRHRGAFESCRRQGGETRPEYKGDTVSIGTSTRSPSLNASAVKLKELMHIYPPSKNKNNFRTALNALRIFHTDFIT